MNSKNILMMMSGSIAAAKATGLISSWVRQGHKVRVVATASAGQFIGPATLEGLSGHPVFDDAFEQGRAMDHISLAQWADLVVLCPATANQINKLAAGIADDALSTLWQATWGRRVKHFVVPAMNMHMWRYPATVESIEKLRGWGVEVLPAASGSLACGESGAGRMLEIDQIEALIKQSMVGDQEAHKGRVLVTAGGTREPIDAVRYIGNLSTGRTGATLTDALQRAGFEVTWLGATNAIRPVSAYREAEFTDFADLDSQLNHLLGNEDYDLVIHAAAVSDFSVAEISNGSGGGDVSEQKITSADELVLRLKPNPKLVARIKQYSRNSDVQVVAFKLTVGADARQAEQAIQRLFSHADIDAVVHNDLTRITEARHAFSLHYPDQITQQCSDSLELAAGIENLLEIDA